MLSRADRWTHVMSSAVEFSVCACARASCFVFICCTLEKQMSNATLEHCCLLPVPVMSWAGYHRALQNPYLLKITRRGPYVQYDMLQVVTFRCESAYTNNREGGRGDIRALQYKSPMFRWWTSKYHPLKALNGVISVCEGCLVCIGTSGNMGNNVEYLRERMKVAHAPNVEVSDIPPPPRHRPTLWPEKISRRQRE